jgi:D-alanine-D-alanine ligase-like ATP-grasp enzyme
MGDEVRLVIHRQSTGQSHLNNTSQGGQAQIIDVATLDRQMLEESVQISKALGREVTGVDMIQDKHSGEFYFLEVNNMPQLSTGSMVEQKAKALDAFFTTWLEES